MMATRLPLPHTLRLYMIAEARYYDSGARETFGDGRRHRA